MYLYRSACRTFLLAEGRRGNREIKQNGKAERFEAKEGFHALLLTLKIEGTMSQVTQAGFRS